MAQLLKHLPHKEEDLSVDPQHSLLNSLAQQCVSIVPVRGARERWMSERHPRSVRDSLSKCKVDGIKEDPQYQHLASACTHMHK